MFVSCSVLYKCAEESPSIHHAFKKPPSRTEYQQRLHPVCWRSRSPVSSSLSLNLTIPLPFGPPPLPPKRNPLEQSELTILQSAPLHPPPLVVPRMNCFFLISSTLTIHRPASVFTDALHIIYLSRAFIKSLEFPKRKDKQKEDLQI